MKRRWLTILVVLLLALFITSLALAAAEYNLITWTAEGGGGCTQASSYTLNWLDRAAGFR